MFISGVSELGGSQNVIRLPDLTTLNWKSGDGIVRVNCKADLMHVIESKTNLRHIDNGVGDQTREFSFIVESFADLIDVIYVLKRLEIDK